MNKRYQIAKKRVAQILFITIGIDVLSTIAFSLYHGTITLKATHPLHQAIDYTSGTIMAIGMILALVALLNSIYTLSNNLENTHHLRQLSLHLDSDCFVTYNLYIANTNTILNLRKGLLHKMPDGSNLYYFSYNVNKANVVSGTPYQLMQLVKNIDLSNIQQITKATANN